MELHQQRVLAEHKELIEKREKLAIFIAKDPIFGKLPTDEQTRLRRQLDIMLSYEGILQERIDHFPGAKGVGHSG